MNTLEVGSEKLEVRSEGDAADSPYDWAVRNVVLAEPSTPLLDFKPRGISMEVQGKVLGIMSLAMTIPTEVADIILSYGGNCEHLTVYICHGDGKLDEHYTAYLDDPKIGVPLEKILDRLQEISERKEVLPTT